MTAVYTTGYGDFDKLELRHDVPVPQAGPGELLICVGAAAINNTDINTRIGWYARDDKSKESWSGSKLNFPLIQGGDCCGRIVDIGQGVSSSRLGDRVIVRNIFKPTAHCAPHDFWVYGSECNGAFAQYTVALADETDSVDCDWTDAELACIPVAYSTAEAMLDRVKLSAETVLITGASGGVGTAAVQLAKRRGATVIALASEEKHNSILAMGADTVLDREAELEVELGENAVDVVMDLVAGKKWPSLPIVLKPFGRYVVAGAIAGPIVQFDTRNLYLKDQTYFGVTYRDGYVSENLVKYIERGEIKPPNVAQTYPLHEIVRAQKDFLEKNFVGKLVLVPLDVEAE